VLSKIVGIMKSAKIEHVGIAAEKGYLYVVGMDPSSICYVTVRVSDMVDKKAKFQLIFDTTVLGKYLNSSGAETKFLERKGGVRIVCGGFGHNIALQSNHDGVDTLFDSSVGVDGLGVSEDYIEPESVIYTVDADDLLPVVRLITSMDFYSDIHLIPTEESIAVICWCKNADASDYEIKGKIVEEGLPTKAIVIPRYFGALKVFEGDVTVIIPPTREIVFRNTLEMGAASHEVRVVVGISIKSPDDDEPIEGEDDPVTDDLIEQIDDSDKPSGLDEEEFEDEGFEEEEEEEEEE